jgi:hypothetical protein
MLDALKAHCKGRADIAGVLKISLRIAAFLEMERPKFDRIFV